MANVIILKDDAIRQMANVIIHTEKAVRQVAKVICKKSMSWFNWLTFIGNIQ